MKILDSKYLRPVGMKLGSEYTLTNNNVWKIATDSGLQEANQEEADYNQVILETALERENYVLAEVSIVQASFTQAKVVRGIINLKNKEKQRLQIRI